MAWIRPLAIVLVSLLVSCSKPDPPDPDTVFERWVFHERPASVSIINHSEHHELDPGAAIHFTIDPVELSALLKSMGLTKTDSVSVGTSDDWWRPEQLGPDQEVWMRNEKVLFANQERTEVFFAHVSY